MNLPDRPIPSYLKIIRNFVRISRTFYLQVKIGKKIQIGSNFIIGKNSTILPPNYLKIGDNVALGANVFIQANVEIGSDVLVSSSVAFVGNDHRFDDPSTTIYYSGRLPPSTIKLEGDNLIGYGTIIVGNVNIGKGCIVGAGSVVTHNLPPYTICVGVPAKPIKNRFLSLQEEKNI